MTICTGFRPSFYFIFLKAIWEGGKLSHWKTERQSPFPFPGPSESRLHGSEQLSQEWILFSLECGRALLGRQLRGKESSGSLSLPSEPRQLPGHPSGTLPPPSLPAPRASSSWARIRGRECSPERLQRRHPNDSQVPQVASFQVQQEDTLATWGGVPSAPGDLP